MCRNSEIKRGFGGIRDVEFAVQLLQLVHGRFDEALRSPNTLDVLVTLAEHDYVRDDDAQDLALSYQWLRNLEHRIQLYDLQQTHTLAGAIQAARTRLAKSMGFRDNDQQIALDQFEEELVRPPGHHPHYPRTPLLPATARSVRRLTRRSTCHRKAQPDSWRHSDSRTPPGPGGRWPS